MSKAVAYGYIVFIDKYGINARPCFLLLFLLVLAGPRVLGLRTKWGRVKARGLLAGSKGAVLLQYCAFLQLWSRACSAATAFKSSFWLESQQIQSSFLCETNAGEVQSIRLFSSLIEPTQAQVRTVYPKLIEERLLVALYWPQNNEWLDQQIGK